MSATGEAKEQRLSKSRGTCEPACLLSLPLLLLSLVFFSTSSLSTFFGFFSLIFSWSGRVMKISSAGEGGGWEEDGPVDGREVLLSLTFLSCQWGFLLKFLKEDTYRKPPHLYLLPQIHKRSPSHHGLSFSVVFSSSFTQGSSTQISRDTHSRTHFFSFYSLCSFLSSYSSVSREMPPSGGVCRVLLREAWTNELRKRQSIQPMNFAKNSQKKKDPKLLTPSLTRHMQIKDLPQGFASRYLMENFSLFITSFCRRGWLWCSCW